MKARTFHRFQELIYDTAGIHLSDNKETLVSARLGKRVRALGLDSPERYLDYLAGNEEELVNLLDAVSTNVTSFFRESDHFDVLRRALASWVQEGPSRIRLWSAACSSGEEPYTMAMVARQAVPEGTPVRILATDISTKVLRQATEGIYPQAKVDPVPAELRHRWMTRERTAEGALWQVRDELRQHVVFRRLNLAQPPLPFDGPLEAVFCRNVMIYFDRAVRQRLVSEIERVLRPGGLLFVGHSESLNGLQTGFRVLQPSVYRKAM